MGSSYVLYLHMASVSAFELEYVIRGMSFDIMFDEEFFPNSEERTKIFDYLRWMSREICIDKSYVDLHDGRPGAFMLEEGWNSLKDLLADSSYGADLNMQAQASVAEIFAVMAKCYMYECAASFLGSLDNAKHISIEVQEDCVYKVVICKSANGAWKNAIGCWQEWEFDDDGKPHPPRGK